MSLSQAGPLAEALLLSVLPSLLDGVSTMTVTGGVGQDDKD